MKVSNVKQLLELIHIQLTHYGRLDEDVSFKYDTGEGHRPTVTVTDSANFTGGQLAALIRKILETMLIDASPQVRTEIITSINAITDAREINNLDLAYVARRDTLREHIRGDSASWTDAINHHGMFGADRTKAAKTAAVRSTAKVTAISSSIQTPLLDAEAETAADHDERETRFEATYSERCCFSHRQISITI